MGISVAKPKSPLMLLSLPSKPFNGLLVLPVITIVLAVLLSDIGFQTIALPSRLVVAHLSCPHPKVQLIFYRLSGWLGGVEGGVGGGGQEPVWDGSVSDQFLMGLVAKEAMLVLMRAEAHNISNNIMKAYLK